MSDQLIWISVYDQGILIEEQQIPLEDFVSLENYYAHQGYEVRAGGLC